MKDFKKLNIWQKGMEIVEDAYRIAGMLPITEKFSISSQLTSATISIPTNIAEGGGRKSPKYYNRFLEYSLGSAFEVETLLLIIQRLKMIENDLTGTVIEKIIEEQKMLQSFISKVSDSIK
jgi:four helix bundle protein